jgi:hypothetical protein
MSQRLMVDQCLKLDVHRLNREGYLSPNSQFEWIWRGKENQVEAAIKIYVSENGLKLRYAILSENDKQVIRESLPFRWSGCNGGRRHWIQCPGCIRRIAILYLRDGRFRCRTCHGLLYPSQYPQGERAYGRRYRILRA